MTLIVVERQFLLSWFHTKMELLPGIFFCSMLHVAVKEEVICVLNERIQHSQDVDMNNFDI